MDPPLTPRKRSAASDVLMHARRNAHKKDEYRQGGFHFVAIWDHILESQCTHEEERSEGCSRCRFQTTLSLPEYPEMVFPHNSLTISFINHPGSSITFNALDALKMVSADTLPNVQVAPSLVWQEAQKSVHELCRRSDHPFDWTYTTDYAGTLTGCRIEDTTEEIDMERLKRQDAIGFYSQCTLYEDELADHGSAQMSVRLRVMPTFFFALVRFYLRVDKVLIRVCDTRMVGDNNSNYILREWSRREAKVDQLTHLAPEVLLDGNQVWASLPVVASKLSKIIPDI